MVRFQFKREISKDHPFLNAAIKVDVEKSAQNLGVDIIKEFPPSKVDQELSVTFFEDILVCKPVDYALLKKEIEALVGNMTENDQTQIKSVMDRFQAFEKKDSHLNP